MKYIIHLKETGTDDLEVAGWTRALTELPEETPLLIIKDSTEISDVLQQLITDFSVLRYNRINQNVFAVGSSIGRILPVGQVDNFVKMALDRANSSIIFNNL